MKTSQIIILILVGLITVAVCTVAGVLVYNTWFKAEPTPPVVEATVPPAVADQTPEPEAGDSAWDRIKAAGKIIVGTSADYPPFEYYDDAYELDGYDIALMNEIGKRLGVEVEYHNFAFDGLGSALYLQQVDAVIAAVSLTPDREAEFDFTNVYFVGEDGVLADANSTVSLETAEDLAGYRLGVQRASVYQGWAEENLVATGLMSPNNIFVYEKADDAIRDLGQQRLDFVMMDAQPAKVAATSGGFKLIKRGLNTQRFGIAVGKGEVALRDELNRALTELSNEGFMDQLGQEYLNLAPESLLPTPTPTAVPAATDVPVGTSTPPPAGCRDGLALVQHLNYDDKGMTSPPQMYPGQPFVKQWQVKNNNTCTWDTSYVLVYAHGNNPSARMGGQPLSVTKPVAPGETYDIAQSLVAPLNPGIYQGFWQMTNARGTSFGERLPVGIQVVAAATVTPVPTTPPSPNINFTVDRDHIKQGECVNFYWKVQNAQSVYFFSDGERWQDNGVTGEETRKECPPATLSYHLKVFDTSGNETTQTITIYVEAAANAPFIKRFTVAPPDQITLEQCVAIQWVVEGTVSKITITANDQVLWDGAPTSGNTQDCPSQAGVVSYGIVAVGPGGTSEANHNITVLAPEVATPVPTLEPDLPLIYAFTVNPQQIKAGECVQVTWKTGGGTTYVNIYRGEQDVWEDPPFQGSVQDCPAETGTLTYGIQVWNAADKTIWQEQEVQVSE